MSNEIILVVSGAGYIGSHMVKDLLETGREVVVLDDQVGGFAHLAATTNRTVRNPYKGGNRCAASFRAEVREGLCIAAGVKGRAGQQVGGNHITLTAASMYAYFYHVSMVRSIVGRIRRLQAGDRGPPGFPGYTGVSGMLSQPGR